MGHEESHVVTKRKASCQHGLLLISPEGLMIADIPVFAQRAMALLVSIALRHE